MRLSFEHNDRENSVRIFQTNGITKIRIASRNNATGKISLANVYRKQLERDKLNIKDVCETLECEYHQWMRSTSPLRNLTEDQAKKLIQDLKAINILSVCFQDRIQSLSVLNELDKFSEVTKDLDVLNNSLLEFTNKIYKITGIDDTIELGNIADEINELIDSK